MINLSVILGGSKVSLSSAVKEWKNSQHSVDTYVWNISILALCYIVLFQQQGHAPPPSDLDCSWPKHSQTSGRAKMCSWVATQVTGPRGSTTSPRENLLMSTDREALEIRRTRYGPNEPMSMFHAAKDSIPLLAPGQKILTIIMIPLSHNGTTFLGLSRLWTWGLLCLGIWRHIVWHKVTNILRGRKGLLSPFSGRPNEWNMVETYGCFGSKYCFHLHCKLFYRLRQQIRPEHWQLATRIYSDTPQKIPSI
jgi:hypothetical protein